jgi:hypothetical protein
MGNVTIQLEGEGMQITGGRLGVVSDERGQSPSERTVNNSAPSGARSCARLSDGKVEAIITGPVDTGTRGEGRVADTLVACLRARERVATYRSGDDGRGEDRVLIIDSALIALQVVTVPADETLWASVAQGSASREAKLLTAAGWIDQTIIQKAAQYDRATKRSMLLAIDVAHFGVLATPQCVAAYLEAHGDPAKHDFAAFGLSGRPST